MDLDYILTSDSEDDSEWETFVQSNNTCIQNVLYQILMNLKQLINKV